jgi:cholesterol transport system auxiliary component
MRRSLTALICAGVLAACAGVQPQQVEKQNVYLLEAGTAAEAPRPTSDLVIEVGIPRARAGFDTDQMAYTRRPGEIEYFSRNRWADAPARMLAPAIAQAIEQSRAFRAVVRAPSAVPVDLRLDTELVRLQQDFSAHPSRIEMSIRAQLIGTNPARVLASAQFDEIEDASSDDPYGGVAAADRALSRLVGRVADFCASRVPRP